MPGGALLTRARQNCVGWRPGKMFLASPKRGTHRLKAHCSYSPSNGRFNKNPRRDLKGVAAKESSKYPRAAISKLQTEYRPSLHEVAL